MANQNSKQSHHKCKTGKRLLLVKTNFCFLIDSHMHIQSNNCAPLPLQWNMLPFKKRKPVSRRKMNDKAVGWIAQAYIGRLGKIGRLSTDMIADVFFGELRDAHMKEEMLWLKRNEEQIEEIVESSNKEERLEEVGKELELSELSKNTQSNFQKGFERECAYYYKNKKLFRICIAKQMDMSYAHYWGKTGLPLYMGDKKNNYYINNFINFRIQKKRTSCGIRSCMSTHCMVHIDPETKNPRDTSMSTSAARTYYHLSADFKFRNHFRNPDLLDKTILFEGDHAEIESLLEKKYVHIIQNAPDEDEKTFEDFERQCAQTRVSVANHSLQLLAFYHYDPRRYYKHQSELTEKIDSLVQNHAFFISKLKKRKYIDTCLSNNKNYSRDLLLLQPHESINSKSCIESLLTSRMYANERVYENILTHKKAMKKALFMGIKMYPRLGYKPEDFKRYPCLKDLYTHCSDSPKIPITTHCSFGGMKFADTFNYQIFDEYIIKEKYDIKESENYVTYTYASPSNWAKVLKEYRELKINLAHFGGDGTWIEGFDITKDYSGDDAYLNWPKEICELIQIYPNVYTDLSCFLLKNKNQRRLISEKLVEVLNKYSGLKDRLLVGSDWYMTESKYTGVGDYFVHMFDLLKQVSREVGYDAWHQFSYINPLRFAGLLKDPESKEKKGSHGPFAVDIDILKKLEKSTIEYGDTIKNYKDGKMYRIGSQEEPHRYIQEIQKNNVIKDSKDIKKNGTLTILSN